MHELERVNTHYVRICMMRMQTYAQRHTHTHTHTNFSILGAVLGAVASACPSGRADPPQIGMTAIGCDDARICMGPCHKWVWVA